MNPDPFSLPSPRHMSENLVEMHLPRRPGRMVRFPTSGPSVPTTPGERSTRVRASASQKSPEVWNLGHGVAGLVAIPCIYALACLVGLVGNTLVFFIILLYAKMKTATNICQLTLAVAGDFMLSITFVVPTNVLHHCLFPWALCSAVLSMDSLGVFTPAFSDTLLSVDCYPLLQQVWEPSEVKLIHLGMCLASSLVTLPLIAIFPSSWSTRSSQAMALAASSPACLVVFVTYTFLLGFLLPVLAISLYLLTMGKMRAAALPAAWQQQRCLENVAWLVLMVLQPCAPLRAFYLVQLLNLPTTSLDATNVLLILSYANSCANPILYGFFSDKFHHSFQQVVYLSCCLLDAIGGAEEKPLDYYATAFKSRGGQCICLPLPCLQEPAQPNPSPSSPTNCLS
ncbi:LOW QUALITY PROTEIN: somatostatin receptor type 4 [Rhynchonycteris naso]